LSGIERQETKGLFEYSVVVVDNDKKESSRILVESFIKEFSFSIGYNVEPEQNIAKARNKAIGNAEGDFVALIDDDEFPPSQWLLQMFKAIGQYRSDGVLGPVIPYFEKKPSRWVLKGRFFDRPEHPSGYVLGWEETRTGNALIRREVFEGGRNRFDPKFGSGGEDRDFFRRMIDKGFRFVWCREAQVYEAVTEERCKRAFMLRRALLRGQLPHFTSVDYAKSMLAIPIYTAVLPCLLFVGHHLFMKFLIKECDHIGRLLARFRIYAIKEKYLVG
jgi:glycosyltransferase involved in cell wall biosynthesis